MEKMIEGSAMPDDLMRQAKTLREEADEIEAQAIRSALGLTAGNVRQASVLLGASTGFLSQAVRPGRRHYGLRTLLNHRKGRPAERPERVAKDAARISKELARLMPKTNGKGYGKSSSKAKANGKLRAPKAAKAKQAPTATKGDGDTMVKRTEAEWWELIDRWLTAKATGANQKDFARENGVGISTLRERASALLAARANADVQSAIDFLEPSDVGAE